MDSLILCILGDIIGFSHRSIKIGQDKFTRKKYGDQYRTKALNTSINKVFGFILGGGINRDIRGFKYSFNTLMLFATLKGLVDNEYKKNCTKEYIKIYEKYGEKKLSQDYFANNTYLDALQLLSKKEPLNYNVKYNDSMVLSRALPFGLLFWKKEQRKELDPYLFAAQDEFGSTWRFTKFDAQYPTIRRALVRSAQSLLKNENLHDPRLN